MTTSNEQSGNGAKLTIVKPDVESLTEQIQKSFAKESEQLKRKVQQTIENIKNKKEENLSNNWSRDRQGNV
jgi:tartrate dehydratase alpha subunit/fumarate hydratase class I-like protein